VNRNLKNNNGLIIEKHVFFLFYFISFYVKINICI
jgi:hypothetical protein